MDRASRSVVLRGAISARGDAIDVRIVGGEIDTVGLPAQQAPLDEGDGDIVDLRGFVLLPAAVEPHAHLDKAFLAETIPNDIGDLTGAIEAMIAARHRITVADTIERAERAARLQAANGYRAVRTHVDVVAEAGLDNVHALAEVRRKVADVIDIEIVALCGWPINGPEGADQRALLGAALDAGADVVGGCPHLDVDTRAATETYLELAAEHGRSVDLHTDETLDAGAGGLADLAEVVIATGFDRGVVASHCVSLGMLPVEKQRWIAERVAEAGIGVVALPQTNLFLQGRNHQAAMPRGVTAVKTLREAGVPVAAGADNLQDPFNPLGRACPFEIAAAMILTAHLLPFDAYRAVSEVAALVIRQPRLSIASGSRADLVAVRGRSLREAIAMAPLGPNDRLVFRAGRRMVPET